MDGQDKTTLSWASENGWRVVLFSARPNPAHRVLVESGVGGECVSGWFMQLAYSGVAWKTRLYNYVLAPITAPIDSFRFIWRYDIFLVPAHALPLGYWIKKWRPTARVIYFNHCPFLADFRGKPWYYRRYIKMMLGAVDGVHSGSWLPDLHAAAILPVPRTISHLFTSDEFDGIRREPTAKDLVIVAALHMTKGIREGIATFQAFRDRLNRPVRLTIIGDGPLRKEIEGVASADKDIRVLGQQPPSVVAAELARSSVLLMLSRFDTFPAAVLEAARAGVLPLMSDRVGSSNLFPKELVVSVGDQEAAVERLLWLYQLSDQEQETLRDRVQDVGRRFTCEHQCASFRQAMTDLLLKIKAKGGEEETVQV